MSGSSTPRLWFNRYDPDDTQYFNDQIPLTRENAARFKEALIAAEERDGHQRITLNRSTPSVQQLVTNDTRLSWPLSVFSTSPSLPSHGEQCQLGEICLARFRTQCPPLGELSNEQTRSPLIRLALASLGACLTRNRQWYPIWAETNRLVVTTIAVRKTQFRSSTIYLSWILNETAAILGDDPTVLRPLNIAHGFISSAMRRSWPVQRLRVDQHQSATILGHLVLLALQNDLTRALHFNSNLDIVSQFGHIPSIPFTQKTLENLEADVLNPHGPRDPAPATGPDLALLELLLIWNHILAQCSPAWCEIEVSVPQDDPNAGALNPSVAGEARLSRFRTGRALSDWLDLHYRDASSESRALYHFCAMSLALPSLRALFVPSRARSTLAWKGKGCIQEVLSHTAFFDPKHPLNMTDEGAFEPLMHVEDPQAPEEAVYHAWRVLDSISSIPHDSPSLTVVYLPAIVFTSALCVRQHLVGQPRSQAQGSLMVLKLFAMELNRLPWPCCPVMANKLTESI